MSQNIFILREGTYPRDSVCVTERTASHVIGYPIGGGFERRIPNDEFSAHFRPYAPSEDSPKWEKGRFGIDDYFGDDGIVGYSKGYLWNGWEQPVFERDAADAIARQFKDMVYEPDQDRYRIDTGHDDEPYDYAVGFDIEFEGTTRHVYPIGDGWTWDKLP